MHKNQCFNPNSHLLGLKYRVLFNFDLTQQEHIIDGIGINIKACEFYYLVSHANFIKTSMTQYRAL